jgi:ribosomal-protein-alanine N-acetyltransferase
VRKPNLARALEVGERVYLREPTRRDEAEIVALNAASRALHRGWVTPPTDMVTYADWMVRCEQANVQCFLACRLEDGAVTGVFTLSQIVRRLFQSAYLGYHAMQQFAGQRYMTEGMQLVLRHTFTTIKLHRVEANIQPENLASIALVKRAGFRLEGFSPRYLKISGRWRDHQRWAMTIDDWRRLRRRRPGPSPGRAPRSPRASSSPGTRRSG